MSIYLRGEIWHIYVVRKGKRIRASLHTRNIDEARLRAAELEAATPTPEEAAEWEFTKHWLSKRLGNMRYRSKGRTEACMSKEDLRAIIARAGGRCELTGIPFSASKPLGCQRAPFAPSVDRIDSKRGYSADNCRLVCFAVNVALNQWGDAVTRRIAIGFVAKEGTFAPHLTA